MNRLAIGCALALATFFLAACGGGSSNPMPNPGPTNAPTQYPPPTNAPKIAYTAEIDFAGALGGAQTIQSGLRRVLSQGAPATPIPVQIVAPDYNGSNIGYDGCLGNDCAVDQGEVLVIVSPAPSAMPTTTLSNDTPHTTVVPTPSPSPGTTPGPEPTGTVSVQTIQGDGTINVQTAGNIVATIGAPVNLAPTTAVYQYLGIALECNIDPRYPDGSSQGWKWTGTAWQADPDPSTADIYVTGSKCNDGYGVAGDPGTLRFPGGGTFLSDDTPFSSVPASAWANTYTSMPMQSVLDTPNPDGSDNALLVAKTRSGVVFKTYPLELGASAGTAIYVSGVDVSGAGPDGF